jgi:hypothetical protein
MPKQNQEQLAMEHRVTSFTFSDGTVYERCLDCTYGKPLSRDARYTGRHTDSPVEVEPIDHEESEPVEVLALDTHATPQAGEDEVIECEDADTGTVTVVLKSELEGQDTDEIGDPESQDSETGYCESA